MSFLRNCCIYCRKPTINTLKYQFRMLHETISLSRKSSDLCQSQCRPPKQYKCPPRKKDKCSSHKEAPCMPKRKVEAGPFFRMPYILRIIGPKHISIVSAFIPSLIIYGVAALIALIYISEFKTVLQFLPFYNTMYNEEETKPKEKPPPPPPPPPPSDEESKSDQC
ncbi:hypothetical protein ILUMI_19847 [Ignelater luminosus]|uniref:Uncharacterized protein n=1 Tax=Ignelater luminosus TaxID=2038154 RepID=A0A8K0CLN7_IGNLU|nr:hypothetical protein ILUMI_19847 [Ignelater luminosus]